MLSKTIRFFIAMAAFSLLSACLSLGSATANFFASLSGQKIAENVAYGELPWQKLNVYQPKDATPDDSRPVLVFFYGGGWSDGSKDDYAFAAEPFTSEGYVVVIPDYAKYPDYLYPTFAEDGAKAVGWVKKYIAQYGGNADKLMLSGHSAGGHLATLLATHPKLLANEGVDRTTLAGVIGLSGPYDFVPEEQKYKDIFAPAGGDASSAMPATYVDGSQAPMLLLYGTDDEVVGIQNLESMQRQVKKHGGELTYKLYKDVGHIGIVAALALPTRGNAPTVKDMLAFIQEKTKPVLSPDQRQ